MPNQTYLSFTEIMKRAVVNDAVVEERRAEERPLLPKDRRRSSIMQSLPNDDETLLTEAMEYSAKEEQKQKVSGVYGAMHGQPAWTQIKSWWFILITLFTLVQMIRINFFVATVRTQYENLLHSRKDAIRLNEVFDIALPAGGIVAIPMIGFVLDHSSITVVLSLMVLFATLIGILGTIPNLWTGYIVCYLPFVHADPEHRPLCPI